MPTSIYRPWNQRVTHHFQWISTRMSRWHRSVWTTIKPPFPQISVLPANLLAVSCIQSYFLQDQSLRCQQGVVVTVMCRYLICNSVIFRFLYHVKNSVQETQDGSTIIIWIHKLHWDFESYLDRGTWKETSLWNGSNDVSTVSFWYASWKEDPSYSENSLMKLLSPRVLGCG